MSNLILRKDGLHLSDITDHISAAGFTVQSPDYVIDDSDADPERWRAYSKSGGDQTQYIAYASNTHKLIVGEVFSDGPNGSRSDLEDALRKYASIQRSSRIWQLIATLSYIVTVPLCAYAGVRALRAPGLAAGITAGLVLPTLWSHRISKADDREFGEYLAERNLLGGDAAWNRIEYLKNTQ